jgi:mono/diheme cytochrome c family protein
MYRGIIQESNGRARVVPAPKIEQYQLDKIISHGRIWRLRYDGVPGVPATPAGPAAQATPEIPARPALPLDRTRPRMFDETPAQLLAHLSHENGWWRDMAQRLLVLRQDRSVVPALRAIVETSDNLLARFHALWTLEGLGAIDTELVRQQMKDPNPRMRVQAVRASETLFKAGTRSLAEDYIALARDPDPDVALQALLTANLLDLPNVEALIRETQSANPARGIAEIGRQVLERRAKAAATMTMALSPEQQRLMQEGETIYRSLCFTCHGEDGRGVTLAGSAGGGVAMMGPPIAGSPRVQGHRDYVIKTIMHGMTGPMAGQVFTQVMLPMGTQTDEWIAAISSYVRMGFGNAASPVTPADVARVRSATAGRSAMWTFDELEASMPRLLPADPSWRATASHNPERAGNGLTLGAWTTGVAQQPGMWFQVELPHPAMLTEIQFDSGPPGGRGARGFGARGGAGRGGAPGRGRAGVPVFGSYPLGYRVQVSSDGTSWSEPVAEGTGGPATTVVSFPPVQARFVRVTQTGQADDAPPWSVLNFRVFTVAR